MQYSLRDSHYVSQAALYVGKTVRARSEHMGINALGKSLNAKRIRMKRAQI